jgi:hypothetical protein
MGFFHFRRTTTPAGVARSSRYDAQSDSQPGETAMGIEGLSKEQRILRVLRKTLGNIVKDTTPRPGFAHPLSENTIRDIKELFTLIAEREAELAREAGFAEERPHFSDEQPSAQVVDFHKPKKPN